MFETGITNVITNGYHKCTKVGEKGTLVKAFSVLSDRLLSDGSYVFGDKLMQKSLDTTALSGITLGTTAATTTKIVEAFDANTFVNVGASTNYTVDTTGKILKATVTTSTATVVTNAYTVASTDNYVVLKLGTETLGTGTISYYVSRDNGTTFTQIYGGTGVFIGAKPTGTSLVFKVVITGNAQLAGGFGIAIR